MAKAKLKRLELRLPEDHEIFSYPSGSRSTVAIAFLDIGMKLSHMENKLDNIEQKISTLKTGDIPDKVSNSEEKAKIVHNLIKGFDI